MYILMIGVKSLKCLHSESSYPELNPLCYCFFTFYHFIQKIAIGIQIHSARDTLGLEHQKQNK